MTLTVSLVTDVAVRTTGRQVGIETRVLLKAKQARRWDVKK
jgi:hypothetical protein